MIVCHCVKFIIFPMNSTENDIYSIYTNIAIQQKNNGHLKNKFSQISENFFKIENFFSKFFDFLKNFQKAKNFLCSKFRSKNQKL